MKRALTYDDVNIVPKYSNAGKGDKSRVSDANKYAENWEKIFGKKKK